MSLLQGMRDFFHKRYVRAAVVALSLVTASVTTTAMVTKIETGASYKSMYRLLTRDRHNGDIRELAESLPGQHEELYDILTDPDSNFRTGGFVYADDGELHFYPHKTLDSLMQESDYRRNLEVYPKLANAYHQMDIAGFVNVLKIRDILDRLSSRGLPTDFTPIEELEESPKSDEERVALFRVRAYRYIDEFNPTGAIGYELPLREQLRFYESNNPPGRYVGTFESYGVNVWGDDPVDSEHAHQITDSGHYITLMIHGEKMIIRDFHRGSEDRFVYDMPTRTIALEEAFIE